MTPTVLVVRPRAQALAWVRELGALGVAARALPLIDILPAPEPARVAAVFAQVAGSGAQPVLVFVSPNAVHGFFDAVAAGAGSPAWPAHARAAATGPGTVAALRERGVPDDCVVAPPADAAQFDSEALWSRVAAWPWAGRPAWIVRGNGGRDWLGQQLRDAGADVRVIQSYARAAPALGADERTLLDAAREHPARWVWMFSSSEAVENLRALAPAADWRAARALASHPRIAEAVVAAGFGAVAIVAPTAAAVALALGHPAAR